MIPKCVVGSALHIGVERSRSGHVDYEIQVIKIYWHEVDRDPSILSWSM